MRLERPDYNYVKGYASVKYGDNALPIPVEKGDITPPTLTVTLTPNTVRKKDKLIPITASMSVKDDYDPQPEIRLEFITASEALVAGDIMDASLGTDDRQFLLKAKSGSKVGRIYTVTYSATDASGNKAMASAIVTVKHAD